MTDSGTKQALSTLSFPRRAAWQATVDTVPPKMRAQGVAARLVRAGGRYPAFVLNGSGSPKGQLLAAVVLSRRNDPPRLMFADCVWGSGGAADRLLVRSALRLLDGPHVHYCVHSHAQRERFPELWGVDIERVHVTPYYYTFTEEDLELPTERDGSVFAGGESHRDYNPLIEAAHRIEAPIVIASGRLTREQHARKPPNLTAGLMPHTRFVRQMGRASVVVVALEGRDDRSAGEQTYLNAMALGKPVVVVDSMGVREYVSHGETGLVVPPRDPAALAEAVNWTLDPAHESEVLAMTERAREIARNRFGPEQYVAQLLRTLHAVLGEETLRPVRRRPNGAAATYAA